MASEYSSEIEEIRDAVQSYCPGSTVDTPGPVKFPDTLHIGLFGRTGCGKTSLINSLRCAAKRKTYRKAHWLQSAGQGMAGGHTMYRKCVEITPKIAVVDNRGMDKLQSGKALEELCAQFAGARGYAEVVEWDVSRQNRADIDGDKIATAIFVFSAIHNIEEDIKGLAHLISLMHRSQGHYPLAVITHVDRVDKKIVEEVKAVLGAQGVSDSCIFTVANALHYNSKLEEEYELNLLEVLDRCMNDGDQAMIFHHHKVSEDKQREAYEKMMLEKEAKLKAELKGMKEAQKLTDDQNKLLKEIQKKREKDFQDAIEENRKAIKKAKEDAKWCSIS